MAVLLWLSRITGLQTWVLRLIAGFLIVGALAGALKWIDLHGAARQRAADAAALTRLTDALHTAEAAARERSAVQRQTDQAQAAQLQTELRGSYASVPDSPPSGVRRALDCERLRGTPAARQPGFSELCGPDSRTQAAAHH